MISIIHYFTQSILKASLCQGHKVLCAQHELCVTVGGSTGQALTGSVAPSPVPS
jgi:hypothetical protein